MPLVGVICDGPCCNETSYSFEEYLLRLADHRCRTHYPQEVVIAMSRNTEERKDAGLSATMILDCPRRAILAQRYPYYERVSDYWARFQGTIGHLALEHYGDQQEGVIREERFARTYHVDGIPLTLTARPDKIDTTCGLLIDYKFVGSVPTTPKPNHVAQLNIYADVLADGVHLSSQRPVSFQIMRAGIIYASWRKVRKLSVDIWPPEQRQKFIEEKLRPFAQFAADETLPPILFERSGERDARCDHCPLRQICDRIHNHGDIAPCPT